MLEHVRSRGAPVTLGLVLISAALLKGHQVATEFVPVQDLLFGRLVPICHILSEFGLGVWLLGGLYVKVARLIAIILFIGFMEFALYEALAGKDSCRCFGKLMAPPWFMFLFDAAAITWLLRWQPPVPESTMCSHGWRFAIVLVLFTVSGVSRLIALKSIEPVSLVHEGQFVGERARVVLEPGKWIGNVNVNDDLEVGEWIVVLLNGRCSRCQELLSTYREHLRDPIALTSSPRVVVIDLGAETSVDNGGLGLVVATASLTGTKRWFADVPATIRIRDGVVLQAHTASKTFGGDAGPLHFIEWTQLVSERGLQ